MGRARRAYDRRLDPWIKRLAWARADVEHKNVEQCSDGGGDSPEKAKKAEGISQATDVW